MNLPLPFLLSLWERFTKDRPEVFITRRSVLYVAVRNRHTTPVRVTGISVSPPLFALMPGHSMGDARSILDGKPISKVIEPGEEHLFPIIGISDSEEHRDTPTRVAVHWRSMRNPALPRIPVFCLLTLKELEAQ